MVEKPEATTSLGLTFESDVLKGAQVSYAKGKVVLNHLFEFSVDPTHVKPLYTDEEGKLFKSSLEKSLVVSTLNSSEVLIRPLEIKLKKDKDIEEVLAFQAEPLLPYPSENAFFDYLKKGLTDEGTLLTILAVRKDHVQQQLDNLSKIDIEPEIISCVPAALTNFANIYSLSQDPFYILHIGLSEITCVLIQTGKLIASQSIPRGLNQLKEALKEENHPIERLEELDLSNPTEETNPILYRSWEAIRLEIKRILFSLGKLSKDQSIQDILITGEGVLVPQLASKIIQETELKQISLNDLPSNFTTSQVLNFAIPIGSAVGGLPLKVNKINFRQNEMVYPHPWKRLIQPLVAYTALCLGLALSFYLFGKAYLSYREDEIKKSYIELLTSVNKPYNTFENEFETKVQKKSPNTEILNIAQLNDEDLLKRVQYLDKELQSTPDLFPLLPNIPKVSDILAWLSTQDVIVGKKLNGEESQTPSIQIESFNYTLVKRPEQNKKQEKYQVKIELEFTSPTPKLAREFHDALITPNDFIDPKGEVKWNSNRGVYRTSFFLKDKTIYP